jgi:hypothetical protein
MAKKNTFLIGGSLAVLISIGALFYLKRQKTISGNFQRRWAKVELKTPVTVNTNHTILGFATFGNKIFLNRIYDVAQIDNQGKVLRSFAVSGKDYLPNEYIIGLDADSAGLYLQDEKKRTFTKLAYDQHIIYQKKIPEAIFRSVYLHNGLYLTKSGALKEKYTNNFFSIYNVNLNSALINDTVMPKNGKGGIDTDGFFLKNDQNDIFHIYYYMSGVIQFDQNGKSLRKINTIDGSNQPPPVLKTENGFIGSPEARIVHMAGSMDKVNIYLASTVKSKDMSQQDFDDNYIIDVYYIKTGVYSHSFLIPNVTHHGMNAFLVKDNTFYLMSGSKYLTIYQLI